jgi:thiol-disulfide isomerase/thioredoxin
MTVIIFSVLFLLARVHKHIKKFGQTPEDTAYTIIKERRQCLKRCAAVLLAIFLHIEPMPASASPDTDDYPAWDHITQNMGILYFYRPTCPYCREQDGILENLEEKGWKNLIRVDITQSPQAAADYGVTTVPSLWLIGNADGEIRQAHISIGLLSETELLRSIADVYRVWFGPAI